MRTQVEAVLLSNEETPAEYRVICEGYPLEYDTDKFVRVDEFRKVMERVKGETFATWTILCHRDDIDMDEVVIHPYIVWTLIARPEGWSFASGDYFSSYEDALKCYKGRL